jgi:hypothetical protein
MVVNSTDRSRNVFKKPLDCELTQTRYKGSNSYSIGRFLSIKWLMGKTCAKVEQGTKEIQFDFALSSKKTVFIGLLVERKLWNMIAFIEDFSLRQTLFKEL